MNRLLELQQLGGGGDEPEEQQQQQQPGGGRANNNNNNDAFSPNGAADMFSKPSAMPAGNDDDDEDKHSNPDGDGFTNLSGVHGAAGVLTSIVAGKAQEYVVQTDAVLSKALEIIESIQTGNREIQELTIKLKNQSAENMKNFNPADDADAGAEAIDEIMQRVSLVSKDVKAHLDELDAETKKLCADEVTMADNAATVKIQQNQHQHLARCFLHYINDYHAAVADNERQLKEQAVRRIKLKYTKADGTTVSDDEARELASQVLDLGRTDALFQQSKEVLAQVLETRNDILRIERSMRELKQMMDDLSALILEQGEILDVILSNVQESVQFVDSGRKHLAKAREHAKDASSKLKYIICCVGVFFLIILASVLGATIPTPGG